MVTVIWGLGGPVSTLKLSDIRNLLLRTSPRFFTRSERNHCRNILWKVNMNNYQKKVKFRLSFAMGPQNVRKSRANFTKKAITRERNEISSPNSRHIFVSTIFGQIKRNCAALPLGGAVTKKQL